VKKICVAVLAIILCNLKSAQGQIPALDSLYGTWKVTTSLVMPEFADSIKRENSESDSCQLARIFIGAKFEIRKDHRFTLQIKDMILPYGYWQYDRSTATFAIKSWKDKNKKSARKNNYMKFVVTGNDGKIYFAIEDFYYKLEVVKLTTPIVR
jgi:hypothetical protein